MRIITKPVSILASFVITVFISSLMTVQAEETTEQLISHFESWVSLGLLIIIFLTANLINAHQPRLRMVGILFSSFICLGAAYFIFRLSQAGALTNVRPFTLPVDALKPTTLLIWMAAFLVAGLLLLGVAYKHRSASKMLALEKGNQPGHYGRISRWLHWSIAISIILLIPIGIFASMIPEGIWYRPAFYIVHKTLGITVMGLIFIRLFWNFKSPRPSLASFAQEGHLKPWEYRLAKSAHLLLYVIMIGFPITGFIMSTYAGSPSYFFIWEAPLLWAADDEAIIPYAVLHKVVLPWLFYLIFVSHVMDALKHVFIDKRPQSLNRMVG